MPRRTSTAIWVGRLVAFATMAGLAGYLFAAGIERVNGIAGVLGLVVAVAALVAPYLLPPAAPAAPAGVSPPSIDISRAQGVQVNNGPGNVQRNDFTGA